MTTLHSGLLTLLAENEGNSRTLPSPGASTRREASDGNCDGDGDGDGNGNGNGNRRTGLAGWTGLNRGSVSRPTPLPQRAQDERNGRSGRHSP